MELCSQMTITDLYLRNCLEIEYLGIQKSLLELITNNFIGKQTKLKYLNIQKCKYIDKSSCDHTITLIEGDDNLLDTYLHSLNNKN